MPRPVLQIELNEINFEFVRAYGRRGKLPTLNALIERHGITQTTSENDYNLLEPWIQWVSAHTGLAYSEHRLFRLGDIAERPEIRQIWEILEQRGLKVGAISPMNAANNCVAPAFFVPDPWTRTKIEAPAIVRRLYETIRKLVNENAQESLPNLSDGLTLVASLMRFAQGGHYSSYAHLVTKSIRAKWQRSLVLDLLLSDLFVHLTKHHRPDFASLFLNAGAHIQHHHMFDAEVYSGEFKNPDWYSQHDTDPIFTVLNLYDRILERIMKGFPEHRIILATGLHQDPYHSELFYWRLVNHTGFLNKLGISFERVEARMSRDGVIYFANSEEAARAQELLDKVCASDGQKLFKVDNRGKSIFFEFIYPTDITADIGFCLNGQSWPGLRHHVSLVAIKNGHHNGVGYLIDTNQQSSSAPEELPITGLFDLALDHFAPLDATRMVN